MDGASVAGNAAASARSSFYACRVQVAEAREGYELWRPNRAKAESKTMKAVIAFVLLVSAALVIVITVGGWERLLGASVAVMSLVWAALYILFAILVLRWSRGILPVAAALAIILAIFAAIAAPDWFARSKDGLESPALSEDLLGLLCLVLVPVQLVLVAVAMIGFNQDWHVEEERPIGGQPLHGEDDDRGAAPAPA
jgi:hypothetical protein